MSYRISLSGYRREKMRSLINSQSTEAIARLHSKVDSDEGSFFNEARRNACKAILTQAINTGIPFADLDEETDCHTLAATFLAQDEQEWLYTSCDYHWEAIRAFRSRTRRYVTPSIRAFITALSEGVPMFGQRFADLGSPYYASLALPKVRAFHEGLLDLQDALPAPDAGDSEANALDCFLSDLIKYLGQIKDAEMDCWFMTG